MIQVEHLVKRYGAHTAVDDLSFTVEKGQIYGFLGPNGAGKSTTMNIMTGYIAASSGTVKINSHDILKKPEKAKKCIGYLPEVPPLYTDMTVWEYLMFVAELKKVPRRERGEHVEEILEKIQLEDVEDRMIRNLSKGYKQRVGLAQALVGDPEVLILDEPMVGLDPKQIMEMRDLIRNLAKEHTVILSSHILSEVSVMCDHIMIISKGRLTAGGSPEQLQEMMHVKAELEVTVLGTETQADEILQNMEQITNYRIEPAQEADSVKIHIEAADNADIRKELSIALAEAGLPILSMNRMERSLEEIFLELTDKEDEDTEAADHHVETETADAVALGAEKETESIAAGNEEEDGFGNQTEGLADMDSIVAEDTEKEGMDDDRNI